MRFNDCRNIRPLPFDFYLPEHRISIEYDGKHHYKPVPQFGGNDYLEKTKIHDNIKTEYCLVNNIRLLRISYTDFNNIGLRINEFIHQHQ